MDAAGGIAVPGGDRYRLLQFHFHSPSEHTLRGKQFPMEVHLVHAKVVDGKPDTKQLLVVGVFFKEGEANEDLQEVWEIMPHSEGEVSKQERFDPTCFTTQAKGYFHYHGSLTTPPCSEIVEWYVRAKPLSAGKHQIDEFSHLFHGNNARPVQPLNGRVVSKF